MDDQRTFRLRVTYVKAGRLAMLSHLEITHGLERIVRRADLPFAISNGFSPHMKIAFGSALPVGIGSSCEIFDLQLKDYVAPAKVLEALKAKAPGDLMPISCEYIEPKAKAASVAFPFSVYRATFDAPVEDVRMPETVSVIRKKKEKTLQVSDYLVGEPIAQDCDLLFQLQQLESGNLRPDDLIRSYIEGLPDNGAKLVSITRISQDAAPIDMDDLI